MSDGECKKLAAFYVVLVANIAAIELCNSLLITSSSSFGQQVVVGRAPLMALGPLPPSQEELPFYSNRVITSNEDDEFERYRKSKKQVAPILIVDENDTMASLPKIDHSPIGDRSLADMTADIYAQQPTAQDGDTSDQRRAADLNEPTIEGKSKNEHVGETQTQTEQDDSRRSRTFESQSN